MISPLINNSEAIKNGWIKKSDKMKYNESFRQAVGEWTGQVPSDSRGGEDTGTELEATNLGHD